MAREAAPVLTTLAALHRVHLYTETGKSLGRLYDVRTRRDPEHPASGALVTEIVYGTSGLLEQLGVRRRRIGTIKWARVIAVEADRIVVRAR